MSELLARCVVKEVRPLLTGNFVCLDFRSELDMLDVVTAVTNHLGRTAGLDENALYDVAVAVRESVVNAIVHGNDRDRSKRVFLEFALIEGDHQGIAIRVRDQGAGFDLTTLTDPRTPENLLKPHGRGIFLIRSLMDEVTLQRSAEGGMEMVMAKRAGRH